MRNVFDQYTQPENRLTHALVTAMAEDPALLRKFVSWTLDEAPPRTLSIVEQQLPGEYEPGEKDYEKLGLPDAWIYSSDGWSLLIESKVNAPLSLDQLKRHLATARKRGYSNITVLAIDVLEPRHALPDYVVYRSWKDVYVWLVQQSKSSEWAVRVRQYMEIAERKWPAEGYLKEGTLTEFSGVHFNEENPYSYLEAKRLIRLIMAELRVHPDLEGFIKSKAPGRAAITGKGRTGVWDFLRLKGFNTRVGHTHHPHLSVNMGTEAMNSFLLVPNSVEKRFRNSIAGLGESAFFDVMSAVNAEMSDVIKGAPGSYPYISMNQRRFPYRSAKPIIDGTMRFDLRTAFPGGKDQKVKVQPQWLSGMYSLVTNKKSHMEFGVGVSFPYENCPRVQSTEILDSIAASWLACRPLLDVMPGR